jgi:diketogulonate reductase-like aldo/keto reductase
VASVLPHVVQNWAEPGRTDEAVRRWCAMNGAKYQPYAQLRNLQFLQRQLLDDMWAIAQRRNTTEHIVALQFFIQLGAVVIPRSTQREHLVQNIEVRDWSLSQEEMRLLEGIQVDEL